MTKNTQGSKWESFAPNGGGFIEFKDQENQEKCMALIDDLITTSNKTLLQKVREMLDTVGGAHKGNGDVLLSKRSILSAITKLEGEI